MENGKTNSNRWFLVAIPSLFVIGAALCFAPKHPHEAMITLVYWGPWCVAVLLGILLLLISISGKFQMRSLSWLCGLLSFISLCTLGYFGVELKAGWHMPVGFGKNFSLSYARQKLPAWPDALYDGGWAQPDVLRQLHQSRLHYPLQVKMIDQYIAAWHFWHNDVEKGEVALWRLGVQAELVRWHVDRRHWDQVKKIARGEYLKNVGESLPSGRVEALRTLARQAEGQRNVEGARRYLLDAFRQSGRLVVEEQDRLWREVSKGLGQDISWKEYYQCLQELAAQSQTTEALGRILFEMRKTEQLHPEILQQLAGDISSSRLPTQKGGK